MMKPRSLLIAAVLAFSPGVASALNDITTDPDPTDPNPNPNPNPDGVTTPEPTFVKNMFAISCLPTCSSDWGAGYSVSARLAATPHSASVPKDKLEGFAQLDSFARINGSAYSLFRVRVSGLAEAKTRTDLTLNAYVGGAVVRTVPFVSQTGTYVPLAYSESWPRTFLDKSVTVGVGPIPVTFTARATGTLAASLTGKISNVGFEAGAGPSGNASLFASAAVGGKYCLDPLGCVGASVGLSVNVTLLEVSTPVTAALWWSLVNRGWGAQLNFNLNSTVNVRTLDGWLKVFASACLGGCLDWDRTLINWPGTSATGTLYSVTGKYCLVGECTPTATGVLQ